MLPPTWSVAFAAFVPIPILPDVYSKSLPSIVHGVLTKGVPSSYSDPEKFTSPTTSKVNPGFVLPIPTLLVCVSTWNVVVSTVTLPLV